MTLDEITEEMLRKPDAQLALEWLQEQAMASSSGGVLRNAVMVISAAYFEGLES